MATKLKFRRTNAAGLPGKYSCDRCGLPSPKGVYTGRKPFEHVCLWCNGIWERLIAAHGRGVLGRLPAWTVYGATEAAERAKRSRAITARMPGKTTIKYRKMDLPSYLETVDHGMTTGELSKVLGVSRSSIYDMAQAGRIPCYRVGTHVRFDPHIVAKWLRAR